MTVAVASPGGGASEASADLTNAPPAPSVPDGGTSGTVRPARPRHEYMDVLTSLAAFCVVWLHSNTLVYTFAPTAQWKQSLFVECVAYWAVPIFFMLSGANLMGYRDRYSTAEFFRHRATKALIPFLAWCTIAYAEHIWIADVPLSWSLLSPRTLYDVYVFQSPMVVYWFFIPLFAIYLAMPVLSLLREHRRVLWFMVVAGFLTYAILPLAAQLAGVTWNAALQLPVTAGFVVFPLLGYLLSTTNVSLGIRILIYVTGSAACATRYLVTIHLSLPAGKLDTLLFNYLYPPGALLACAVFLFVKNCDWARWLRWRPLRTVVTAVSRASLGIYLMHYFIIRDVFPNWGWTLDRTITRTVGAVVAFLIALTLVSVLQRIPGVRRILP